jgi:hypothetical protein
MKELFRRWLAEVNMQFSGVPSSTTLGELAVYFQRWARRHGDTNRVNKFMVRKWIEKILAKQENDSTTEFINALSR